MTERMIRYFIEKAHNRKSFVRPRIIICIPHGITQVERKAVKESAISAGAREVFLVEEPMAAAIGAGIPVQSPNGYVVVDIGGGTTEIGVTSLGGLVLSTSIKVAGDKFDKAIIDYVRHNFNLYIGERTAEEIKIQIGTAVKLEKELKMTVKGRDSSGFLTTIELTSEGVRSALKEPFTHKLKSAVSTIVSSSAFKAQLDYHIQNSSLSDDMLDSIEALITKRLDELSPKMVKELVQKLIHKHLGWLVVWGGLFGGLIGLFSTLLIK